MLYIIIHANLLRFSPEQDYRPNRTKIMDPSQDKEKDSNISDENTSQRCSLPKDIAIEGGTRRRTISDSSSSNVDFPSIIPASPPAFVSLEQILKAAEDVSKSGFNMALAHEIAVNKDFKLQENIPKSNLELKVSEICHKAFWDHLTEQLSSDPPNFAHAMVLLEEIKEILLWLLLPHNSRLKNEINEVLDIELIKQQAEQKTIDVLSYAQFIISTMSRMCSPARDSNIQELRQLTEIVPLYEGILKTLELMKLDMVNFTICHMRPHIQQHSVQYEKDRFKEILQSLEGLTPPVDGLKFTRLWLQKVYEDTVVELNDSKPSNEILIRKAYVKILRWKETENFPETLHLDHERFITLRHNLTVIILISTVILVTYSTVGPAIQGISDFKETLKKHLQIIMADAPECSTIDEMKTKMETVGLQVVKNVNECLESHGYPVLSKENEPIVISSIKAISDEGHYVRQLITKRLLEFIENSLHTTTQLKIPPGLSALHHELSSFAGQFFALVRHNQLVFGDYYDDILNNLKSSQ